MMRALPEAVFMCVATFVCVGVACTVCLAVLAGARRYMIKSDTFMYHTTLMGTGYPLGRLDSMRSRFVDAKNGTKTKLI